VTTNTKTKEVCVTCAVCGKSLVLKDSEAPTNASEMLFFCQNQKLPHVIDWDRDGQIVTFCCGDHLKMALDSGGLRLKNPIPKITLED